MRCAMPLFAAALCSSPLAAQAPTCAEHEATLVPPSNHGARFGQTLDVEGDVAVIGAPQWGGTNDGGVFVYRRSGTTWSPEAFLALANSNWFGTEVLHEQGTLFVNYGNDGGTSGYVAVFEQVAAQWMLVDQIATSRGYPTYPLAFDGDTLVSFSRNAFFTDDDAVYVHRRSAGAWVQEAELVRPVPDSDRRFGEAAALVGDRLVVGSPGDSGDASELSSAYVYERTGTVWTERALLRGSDTAPDDEFGLSVSVRGATIAVGAPGNDEIAANRGAVYVFEHDGSGWTESTKLVPAVASAGQRFGVVVDLSTEHLFVGAPGVPDVPGLAGSVHVFDGSSGGWQESLRVVSPANPTFRFGVDLALDGDTLLVGEPQGSQGTGIAHVLRLDGPTPYCAGKVNSAGCVPFVSASGIPSVSSSGPFRVSAHDVIDGNFGFLLYGSRKANLDFHGGKLCIKAPVERLLPPKFAKPDGAPPCRGVLRRNFNAHIQGGTDPSLSAGAVVFAQWIQRDAGDPAGFGDSLTDALRFEICP